MSSNLPTIQQLANLIPSGQFVPAVTLQALRDARLHQSEIVQSRMLIRVTGVRDGSNSRHQNPIGAKDHHRGTAMRPTRQRLLVCLLRCIAPFSKIVLRLTILPWLWGPQMPIKPVPVSEMDLTRARQIVRSLEALKGLTSDDAEIVARTIAQSFAAGRRQGLEIARDWSDDDWRQAATAGVVSRSATARETSQGECHAQDKAVRPRRS